MRIPEQSAEQVSERLAAGEELTILDCREAFELRLASLSQPVLHVPLGMMEDHADELPKDKPVVVMCHHGVRSMHGASILIQAGLTQVCSMSGGIDRWSRKVDPKVPRY
jgi:rhodanese-related sulfurtransferase